MRQAIIFKSRWGWIGVSETTKGINAVVLPKASRQAVLSELQASSAELLDGRVSPRLREARAQLIDYLAGKRRSFDLSLDLSRGTSFDHQRIAARVRGRHDGRIGFAGFGVFLTAGFDPINGWLFESGAQGMPAPSVMPWGRIRCRS